MAYPMVALITAAVLKANRYLDSENLATVEVGQGTSDIKSASLEALGGTFNFVSKVSQPRKRHYVCLYIGQPGRLALLY